jgi:hypothetical protein
MDSLRQHKNAVIGLKKLSEADLGRSDKSNQTHIGLFENTLNCIDDVHLIDLCYFVTQNDTKKLLCLLDYIENTDGTFRSPKIRKGSSLELTYQGHEINSVVREIRKIAYETAIFKDWYLLWFVTDSQCLLFVLFEYRSELFDLLSVKIDGISKRQQFASDSEIFIEIFNLIDIDLNKAQ